MLFRSEIMKARRIKIASLAACFVIVVSAAVAFPFVANRNNAIVVPNDTTVVTDIDTTGEVTEPIGVVIEQNVSGVVVQLTFEEMLGKCHLAVMGEVTGVSEPFAVKPVNGGDASNFFEYELTVEDAYIGDASAGDKVNVRVTGGLVGNVQTYCAETPNFEIGTKVIAILKKATKGSNLYVTDEDYYLIVGVNQGIFTIEPSGDSVSSIVELKSRKVEDVKAAIIEFSKTYEVDIDDTYKNAINKLNESLKNGRITQEEYDISLRNIESYAERVE